MKKNPEIVNISELTDICIFENKSNINAKNDKDQ